MSDHVHTSCWPLWDYYSYKSGDGGDGGVSTLETAFQNTGTISSCVWGDGKKHVFAFIYTLTWPEHKLCHNLKLKTKAAET